jgi:hypothetical protein
VRGSSPSSSWVSSYLGADDSRMITKQTFTVNGGLA